MNQAPEKLSVPVSRIREASMIWCSFISTDHVNSEVRVKTVLVELWKLRQQFAFRVFIGSWCQRPLRALGVSRWRRRYLV